MAGQRGASRLCRVMADVFVQSPPACIIPKWHTCPTTVFALMEKIGWELRRPAIPEKPGTLAWKESWADEEEGSGIGGNAGVAPKNIHDDWITERFGSSWGENPLALTVADQDPQLAYGTDLGRTMVTRDGGKTWAGQYSHKVAQCRLDHYRVGCDHQLRRSLRSFRHEAPIHHLHRHRTCSAVRMAGLRG